jgi:NitT/TauT family transport system permease protein
MVFYESSVVDSRFKALTARFSPMRLGASNWLIYAASLGLGLFGWSMAAFYLPPLFLPSPWVTAKTVVELLANGELVNNAAVSLWRILAGWAAGGLVGVVLGIALGRIAVVRELLHRVIEYFRFVPPITLVTLFIIWFGVGETSKIVLIAWVSVFIVIVNTMAGAMSVREGAIRAARCLGATDLQVLRHVIVPESVPYVVTGLQLALSNAFMTIVAAEMLAAHSGLGFMIWDAQIYAATERMFVAFAALCVLGFSLDRLVHGLSRRLLAHYRVV